MLLRVSGYSVPRGKSAKKRAEEAAVAQAHLAFEDEQDEMLNSNALASVENQSFLKGSVKIALDTPLPFDRYIFIDKKAAHIRDLERLKLQYYNLPAIIDVYRGDANEELVQLCQRTDWKSWRGVVFLDPYGMTVDWSTMQVLGEKAEVDLWVLFPLAQAFNRLLTKDAEPPPLWSDKLDRFLGVSTWRESFYATQSQIASASGQGALFEIETPTIKHTNFDAMGDFFVQRLQSVFDFAPKPLPLFNSQGVPLYLLCFASQNATALRIARDLLKP